MSGHEKLEVMVDKQNSKYSVTVSWRGTRGSSDFIPPYSQAELSDLSRHVGGFDDEGNLRASNEQLRNIGLKLHKSLFPTEAIRSIVTRCLDSSGGAVDMDLKYNDPEIGRVPWELLHDGTIPLVASDKLGLVRVLELQEPFKSISVHSPLKILAVVAQPLDQPFLEKTPPMDKLKDELRRKTVKKEYVVHFLMPPTFDMLVKWLGKGYDVVQFYGHGGFSGGKGCLAFEDELGLTQLVSADELAVVLRGAGVQLMVLCACHSGETTSHSIFTGVAQSLVGACVPAVVGWSFAVPVDTALAFMQQFYATLASSDQPSVRRAVAQARRALYSRGTAHFPMLFERTLDDRLISTCPWGDEALQPPYEEPKNNFAEPLGIHNLLVGRFRDLRELSRGLASQETVFALWGFCGVGKTALAIRGVYERLLWRFPDGAWYVELRGGKTLDSVLSELCKSMGISSELILERKEDLVLDRLAQTKTLLLLDNFEDVESDLEIVSFLNKVRGSSKVLLTSRDEPQQMAWRRYELREMDRDDALHLFLTIAERADRHFSVSDLQNVLEICRRVDYYPIAITYIAGSITGTLEDAIGELSENPPDPVKAGFEYAYGKLSVNAQELLARLSVLKRSFDTNAIKAVAVPTESNLQLADWKNCMSELRRRALLSFSRNLFSMLTMTRQLASEHLIEPKKWHSIAADHYLSSKGSDPFRAFDHLIIAERWKEAVETINAATSLSSYGLAGELVPRLKAAAKVAAEKLLGSQLQAHSLENSSLALVAQGRYDEALVESKGALRIQKSMLTHDPRNTEYQSDVATILNNLGILQSDMGRFDDAVNSYKEAQEMYRTLLKSDPNNATYQSDVAMTLNNLGNLQSETGRFDDALNSYKEALEMRRNLLKSDPNNATYQSHVATTLNNLGALQRSMGRFDDAVNSYKEALEMRRNLLKSDPNNVIYQSDVATILNNLGNLQSETGRFDDALNSYKEAQEMYRTLLKSDPNNVIYQSDVAMTLNNLGNLQRSTGRFDDALNSYKEAQEMLKNLHENDLENPVYKQRAVSTLLAMSSTFEKRDDVEQAIGTAQSAIDQSRHMLYAEGEAEGFLRLAGLQLVRKDNIKTEEALAEALRIANENDLPAIHDRALVLQGQVSLTKGRMDEALDRFSEACIVSLEHGLHIHAIVVNEVVAVFNRLRREGKEEVANLIGKYLVESWKKRQLDKKFPQFVEYIEKSMSDLQSE
ncbi:DUF3856 domain-containing protein [Candidatus Bathyarchaeota archaeon]|nr:DUF3856 domain-containing protein [Candidatus Bathyarchaeota archaeon]